MADDTANGHSAWSAADFGDLNRAVGMLGPQDVEIIPGKPPIRLDLSGAALLTALGRWGNPVMKARAQALDDAVAELGTRAETTADAPGDSLAALEAAVQANLEYFDCVLQAVLISPEYQSLESLRRDGPKPSHLHVLAFTLQQRAAVQSLVLGGADALARFRADPAGFIAGPPVPGLQAESRDGAPPPDAAPSGDVAERGDLAPSGDVGSRTAGRRSSRSPDAPPARDIPRVTIVAPGGAAAS